MDRRLLDLGLPKYPAKDFRFYGTVSEDLKTITIPAGQSTVDELQKGIPLQNAILVSANEVEFKGDIVFTSSSDGTFTTTTNYAIVYTVPDEGLYAAGLVSSPTTWKKK